MSLATRQTVRRAFTLIELLVVIGIISVLFALLLPSLNRAKDHANRIKCAANLRGIGQALTEYAQRNSYYPACYDPFNNAIWPIKLRTLIGNNLDVFYCPSQDDRCRWSKIPALTQLRSGAEQVRYGYELSETLLSNRDVYFSYGYNARGEASNLGLGVFEVPEFSRRITQVRNTSEMIAIADTTVDGRYDFETGIERSTSVMPGQVHRGGANVLYCDGHVKWSLQSELIWTSGKATPQIVEIMRRWNYDHIANIERSNLQ